MDLRDFVEFHVENNPTHAKIIWIFCLDFQNETFNFLFQTDFLPRTLLLLKKKLKIEMMCATLTGFSVQWQLLFLSSFPSPPPVDFSELPSTKNIRDICRSVSDYSTSQIFPSALCHFHHYPTLLKHWFSKFSRLPVVCLTSITLRYLFPMPYIQPQSWRKTLAETCFHQVVWVFLYLPEALGFRCCPLWTVLFLGKFPH